MRNQDGVTVTMDGLRDLTVRAGGLMAWVCTLPRGDFMTQSPVRKRTRLRATRSFAAGIGLCALLASGTSAAIAQTGILLSDARQGDSASLETGEQLLLAQRSEPLTFAGRQIALSAFTGIIGYANELAYVVVLDGSAAADKDVAGAGQMLILRPYGAPVSVEQFDAIRLSKQWSDRTKSAAPAAYASLERIKGGQERGVWFGRLGQTSFNVAASGSARHEQQTRALMGDPVVRDIRFSGASEPREVERLVVARFVDALKAGNADAVAALMDPTPFGGRTLAGGADNARLLAAGVLIKSRNWGAVAGASTPQLSDGVWRVGDVLLQLRSIDDFVFVSRISGETR